MNSLWALKLLLTSVTYQFFLLPISCVILSESFSGLEPQHPALFKKKLRKK